VDKTDKVSETRFHFTQKAIRAIEPPAGKRASYRDAEVRELGLLVRPSGFKSYFWFRKIRGRPTWKTIGTVEDTTIDRAREQARAWSVAAAEWKRVKYQGDNPLEPARKELTFSALVSAYLERHLKAHAHRPDHAVKNVTWAVDCYLSAWKNRTLGQIRRSDVRQLHERLGEERGHPTANRVATLIRTLFNFAIRQELWSGANPVIGLDMYHEDKRERFVQPEEMPKLLAALGTEENPDVVDYVCLALWTGARKSDIVSMRWQDISLADNRWTIPHPKNRRAYVVALVPEVVEILKKRPRVGDWVFPGCGKSGHVMDFKKRWKALLQRAGITNLRQHDLRRTLGSFQAAGGASLQIIGKSLGHTSIAATAIYARMNLDPVRKSVEMAVTAMLAAGKKKSKRLAAVNGD
jgi:integrase